MSPLDLSWIKSSIFWDISLCCPLKVNLRFGRTYRLHLHSRRISRARSHLLSRWCLVQLNIRPLIKQEAACSSETSVEFQRTTRRYIQDGVIIHNHCFENIKPYISWISWGSIASHCIFSRLLLLYLWLGFASISVFPYNFPASNLYTFFLPLTPALFSYLIPDFNTLIIFG
jgi:hypothetical protein